MRDLPVKAIGLISALLVTSLPVKSESNGYSMDEALTVSQAAIGRQIDDLILNDSYGQPIHLASLRGKPLVVSLIYTSCHHVCPLITRNLARNVAIATEALGTDSFNIVSVGFDWAVDTPDRMRMFAAGQGVKEPNWLFLSGGEEAVTRLSANLGFLFWPSAKGFDHLAQTTILDASGRVYRQVYGPDPGATAMVEPIKEIIFDTPADASLVVHWANRLRLLCTVFDPNSGRYRFDYSIFMTILTGILSLGAVGWFVIHEWRKTEWRH